MRNLLEPGISRREFFRAAGRYTLLGCLAVGGAVAGTRRGLPGQTCVNQGICGSCGQFVQCGLPAALSVKQSRKGNLS